MSKILADSHTLGLAVHPAVTVLVFRGSSVSKHFLAQMRFFSPPFREYVIFSCWDKIPLGKKEIRIKLICKAYSSYFIIYCFQVLLWLISLSLYQCPGKKCDQLKKSKYIFFILSTNILIFFWNRSSNTL